MPADPFTIEGRMRRWPGMLGASGLIVAGAASVFLFAIGLLPGYDFESDGGTASSIPNIARRCPERVITEQGFDGACAQELISRGPLFLGKEALAGSFPLGAAALFGASRVERRLVTWVAAGLLLGPYLFVGGLISFSRWTPGPVQVLYLVGLAAVIGVFLVGWWLWERLALAIVSIVYLASWVGLLAWNAAEARRHLSG